MNIADRLADRGRDVLGDLRGLANRAAAPDLAAASGDLQPQVDAVQDEIRLALQKCASAPPA